MRNESLRHRPQAVRLAVVVSWSGRTLLALAGAAAFLGAMWTAANVVLLAGAYGLTGSVITVAGVKAR